MISLFGNKRVTIIYIVLWVIYAALHVLSIKAIVNISVGTLVFDSVAHAVIYSVLGILLWQVIQHGNYKSLPVMQKYINYTAIGFIILLLWVGLGFASDYIFLGKSVSYRLLPLLPYRLFTGLLIYLILVLSFQPKDEEAEYAEEQCFNEFVAEQYETDNEIIDRITIKSGQKINIVSISDILYLQSYGDYVQIITDNGKFIKEQTMKYYELHLPNNQFVRIHRSYIVNVENISRIELHSKQSQLITLKNGTQLKASVGGYKLLKDTLNL